MFGNPADVLINFIAKALPKAWLFLLKMVGGIVKLVCRLGQDDDPHGARV